MTAPRQQKTHLPQNQEMRLLQKAAISMTELSLHTGLCGQTQSLRDRFFRKQLTLSRNRQVRRLPLNGRAVISRISFPPHWKQRKILTCLKMTTTESQIT